jgi:hypothetical protein
MRDNGVVAWWNWSVQNPCLRCVGVLAHSGFTRADQLCRVLQESNLRRMEIDDIKYSKCGCCLNSGEHCFEVGPLAHSGAF